MAESYEGGDLIEGEIGGLDGAGVGGDEVVGVEPHGEGYGELPYQSLSGVSIRGGSGEEEGDHAPGRSQVRLGDELGAADQQLAHVMRR